jgi:hypothetical protein
LISICSLIYSLYFLRFSILSSWFEGSYIIEFDIIPDTSRLVGTLNVSFWIETVSFWIDTVSFWIETVLCFYSSNYMRSVCASCSLAYSLTQSLDFGNISEGQYAAQARLSVLCSLIRSYIIFAHLLNDTCMSGIVSDAFSDFEGWYFQRYIISVSTHSGVEYLSPHIHW